MTNTNYGEALSKMPKLEPIEPKCEMECVGCDKDIHAKIDAPWEYLCRSCQFDIKCLGFDD